jgi:hypothetical protein
MAPELGTSIHQLPLIPADVLKKHRVHEPLDTRFRSAARLLQALWREDRDLPIGSYINEDSKRRKLGSRRSKAAGKEGRNFLTPKIAHIARRETAYREVGGLPNLNARPRWPGKIDHRCGDRGSEGILTASVNSPALPSAPTDPARMAYASLPLIAMPCK